MVTSVRIAVVTLRSADTLCVCSVAHLSARTALLNSSYQTRIVHACSSTKSRVSDDPAPARTVRRAPNVLGLRKCLSEEGNNCGRHFVLLRDVFVATNTVAVTLKRPSQ